MTKVNNWAVQNSTPLEDFKAGVKTSLIPRTIQYDDAFHTKKYKTPCPECSQMLYLYGFSFWFCGNLKCLKYLQTFKDSEKGPVLVFQNDEKG